MCQHQEYYGETWKHWGNHSKHMSKVLNLQSRRTIKCFILFDFACKLIYQEGEPPYRLKCLPLSFLCSTNYFHASFFLVSIDKLFKFISFLIIYFKVFYHASFLNPSITSIVSLFYIFNTFVCHVIFETWWWTNAGKQQNSMDSLLIDKYVTIELIHRSDSNSSTD